MTLNKNCNNLFFLLFVTISYFVIGLIIIQHHEMWRDELQAWLIARDSSTLNELFNNLKYEGHPGLWHLVLTPVTRAFKNPHAMQYLNLFISTASIFLLVAYAPFSKIDKVLISFGYYLFYEYGIISRNYSLSVFFIFLYCALRSIKYQKLIPITLVLLLLANTSVFGLIIAVSFFVSLATEIKWQKNSGESSNSRIYLLYCSALIFTLGALAVISQLVPPPDSGFATSWTLNYNFSRLRETFLTLFNGFFPIPDIGFNFWNKSLLVRNVFFEDFAAITGFVVFIYFFVVLLRRPSAALAYCCSTFGILLFFYIKYIGSWRHHGFLYIVLISSLWLSKSSPQISIRKALRFNYKTSNLFSTANIFHAIVVANFVGFIIAAVQDFVNPFSSAEATALFIKKNKLDNLEIVADKSPQVSSILAYLDGKKAYYIDSSRYGTFIKWDDKRYRTYTPAMFLEYVQLVSSHKNADLLLLLNYQIDSNPQVKFIELLYSSPNSIVRDESFFVYKINSRVH